MSFEIRRLDDSWWNQIATLRQEAYRRFGDDLKNPYLLTYGPSDRAQANIAIIEHDKIASLLRIEKHRSPESLRFALQTEAAPSRYPTALLSRAATAIEHAEKNLNMLLRQVAIQAMVEAGYSDVFGTFKASARRSGFLKSIGYALSSPEQKWNDFLQTNEPIRLAHLDLKIDGPTALEKLRKITGPIQSKFSITDAKMDSLVRELVVFLES